MVLYTIKNLLLIKDILKTLTSSGIHNYIKILQRQCSRKTAMLYLLHPVFDIKIFTNNKK